MGQNVSLVFAGDVYFDNSDVRLSPEIAEITSQSNLMVINLEGPLTQSGTALKGKKLCLGNHACGVSLLKELSVSIASLANNHICDWSEEGLKETIRILNENGIAHVGAGLNIYEAQEPVVINIRETSLGFLAYGSVEIGTRQAGENCFGAAAIAIEKMYRDISKLKQKVDHVIVLVHWDTTGYHYPMPETIELGRNIVDAGATLVVGHHPHVIQGYESYKEGAIAYSLGNFIFTDTVKGRLAFDLLREEQKGLLLRVELCASRPAKVEFIHTKANHQKGRIEVCVNDNSARRQFLRSLCLPLDKPNYAGFYRLYTAKRMLLKFLLWLNPKRWKKIRKGHFVGLYKALRRILFGRR